MQIFFHQVMGKATFPSTGATAGFLKHEQYETPALVTLIFVEVRSNVWWGILGTITRKYPLYRACIGISHRSTMVGVHPTIPCVSIFFAGKKIATGCSPHFGRSTRVTKLSWLEWPNPDWRWRNPIENGGIFQPSYVRKYQRVVAVSNKIRAW